MSPTCSRCQARPTIGALPVAGVTLLVAVGCAAPSRDATPLTFNKDIAAIVWKNCSRCHRPGEAGPFSLLTYDDVRSHARQIVAVTRSRIMPPWLPEPGYGDFVGQRRLSQQDIDRIERWVENG